MSAKTDIIVLGAGAAGLAAARELRRQGFDVLVLEARDRIGGRILTHHDPRVPIPIELGAELIHGETPETLGVLREAGLAPCDVRGEQWRIRSGRVQPFPDVWKRTERVLAHIDGRKADRSFAEFLAEQPGGRRLAPDRTIARRFVQGFHAADPDCLSTRSLAGGGETAGVRKSGRVLEGYGSLPAWLARDLEGRIRLDAPVEAIEWSRGQVEVTARGARITARAAVITVPLGVLQAPSGEPGAFRISPDPPRLRRILDGLAMGSAVRLAVWFRELPWEKAAKRDLSRLSFLHTSGEFNVWWSAYPVQVPLAVAWSGGPPAARLARQSRPDLEAQAFRGLAHQLGIPRRRVESLVVETWMHDWVGDPFSRGAYSYPLVGGSEAAQALSRPFDGTLFFAGEATALQNGNGTVEGALASGRRAAGQVARSRDAMQRNIREHGKQHTRRP